MCALGFLRCTSGRVTTRTCTILLLFMVAAAASYVIPISSAVDWSSDQQLTFNDSADFSPSITQTLDGRIWVFWHSFRVGNDNAELFYKAYDGLTWTTATRLTDNSGQDVNPAVVTTQEGVIWLVWASNRVGNYELFCKTSTDNGASWSTEIQTTNDGSSAKRPSIMQAADGKIWLVWHTNRTGNEELFFKVYDGISWSDETQLTFNEHSDMGGSIMQSNDGKIWVFWGAYKPEIGDFEIFYMTSSDDGFSWSVETRLTDNNAWDMLPSAMQARDGRIWVVWEADRSGFDDDLFYQTSDGISWSGDTKLTGGPSSDEILPTIYQAEDKTIWIAFSSGLTGNFNIYYKTATNPHDIAILNVTTSSAYAYRDYGINVYIKARNCGTSTETFTVTVYCNGTAVETKEVTSLAPSAIVILSFTWSATDAPLGYYEVSASTGMIDGEADPSDNSLTDGTVHVRIVGDVNGDRTVNVLDAILLTKHFGNYDAFPAGDINNDGVINVLDAILLAARYGDSS